MARLLPYTRETALTISDSGILITRGSYETAR